MIYCWTRGTLWKQPQLSFFSLQSFPFCHPSPREQLMCDSLSLTVGTKQQALLASLILSTRSFFASSIFRPPPRELGSLSVERLVVHNLKTSPLITWDIRLRDPMVLLKVELAPLSTGWHGQVRGHCLSSWCLSGPPSDGWPCPRDLAFCPPPFPVFGDLPVFVSAIVVPRVQSWPCKSG